MKKKKQCVNCKHGEFGCWDICCNKFNKDVSESDKACKYYKRDIYGITSGGIETFIFINDQPHEWIRGRFRLTVPFWEGEVKK